MAKSELIANDPVETKLMAFSETVHKTALIAVVLDAGVLLGMAVVQSDLLVFAGF